ncbi:hypothetical protein ACF08O_08470 [Streptomyces paradoxus]|uniref:hypothetical protein n=1 Tax=Streptomyces paradoxus TaxID=66375 RepID=UPI0036FD73FB
MLHLSTGDAGQIMRTVGKELADRLKETVLRLELDNRDLPMDRDQDEEEDLARLLITAAWCQVNYRTPIGFAYTPLAITAREDPGAFTLERLLQLPHRDMVADVVAQLYKTADGPLKALRDRSRPEDCTPGPTFSTHHLTADADLAVDGLLLDFTDRVGTRISACRAAPAPTGVVNTCGRAAGWRAQPGSPAGMDDGRRAGS